MSECDACGLKMNSATSCASTKLVIAGRSRKRVPYGVETVWTTRSANTRCGDCGVHVGGVHHPGCAVEQCPRCGAQLFCCDCLKAEIVPMKKTRVR